MYHTRSMDWRWRLYLITSVIVSILWSILEYGECKPLSTQNDDTEWTQMPSSDVINRIDQLRSNMESFKELRLMLNQQLLNNAGGRRKNSQEFDDSESFLLMASAFDENSQTKDQHSVSKRTETEQKTSAKMRNQQRKQQRRHRQRQRNSMKNQRRTNTENVDATSFMQQDDASASYKTHIQGLQIHANLQESNRQGQGGDQQRRMTSGGLKKHVNECPKVPGKSTQVLCPSRRRHGYRVCIPDTALCNGHSDCPNGEDEDPVNCLFYKTTIHHFRLIVDAVVDLSDLVKRHEKRHSMDEL